MCFNPHIDDRVLKMKKEYQSNIILRNDDDQSLRIAKDSESETFSIGSEEEAYFVFEKEDVEDILSSIKEVVLGKKQAAMKLNDYVIFIFVLFLACYLIITSVNNKAQQQKIFELEERVFHLENLTADKFYKE